MRLTRVSVDGLAACQAGVVTSAQLRSLGADTAWLSRQVRSGHWQRLHRGVLVTHSGPVTWRTRAWAAVLGAGAGAALSHDAAAHLCGMRSTPPGLVDVSIPESRRVMPMAGVVLHRRTAMPPSSGRPRVVWASDTVLDLVRRSRTEDDAVSIVCAGAGTGVSGFALTEAVTRRGGWERWSLLRELVGAVDAGVESALEHRYRRDVEDRHRLPRSALQVREVVDDQWIRADCVYPGLGLRVELDGALAHPGGRTDRDTWRDNLVLLRRGELTLRYRWRHVAVTPCDTALQVRDGLRLADPTIRGRACSPDCPLG